MGQPRLEDSDLRTTPQRTLRRPWSLVVAVIAVLMTVASVAPTLAGASSSHAYETMPNAVGLSRAQAFTLMGREQLFFKTRGAGANTRRWVRVIGEIPAAGSTVSVRSTIILLVTSTPVHHAPVARRVVRAPHLVGRGQAAVLAAVAHFHLRLVVLRIGSKLGKWNEVLAQRPVAGGVLALHGELIVTVVRHVVTPKPKKPTTTTTTTPPSTTTGGTTTGGTTSGTTTTTVPVTTTTTKKPKPKPKKHPAVKERIGDATWYDYVPGRCATWFLPYGTRLYVRDLANGRTISCIDTDREAAHGDRVVDLSETQFAKLAPLARGVIRVRVWW